MIWMGKVASVALLSLGLSIVPANAQSNDMQARVYYYSAEEAYSGGHFQDALKALEKAENLLGKGNARTAALRVKILMGTADYVAAIEAMKVFFSYNPADSLMREIAPLQLEIDQKIEEQKEREAAAVRKKEAAKRAEVARLNAAANRIAQANQYDFTVSKMLGGEDGKDNYPDFMESFSGDSVFFGVTSRSNNIVTEDGAVGRKSIIFIAADGTMKKAFNVRKDAILPTVKMSQSMFIEPIEVSRREEGNPFGFHRYFINPYEMSVDEHPSGQQNLNNGLKDFGSMLALTANDDDHILYSVSTQSKSVAKNGRVRTTYEALTLASHGDDGRRLIKTKNVPVNSDLFELIVTGLFTGQNGGPILATAKDYHYDDIKIEIFDRNLNAQCHYSYKDGSIVGDIKVIRDKTLIAFYKHDGKPFWTTQDTPCGTQYEGKRYSGWVHSPYSNTPTKIITNRFRKETYIIGAGEIVRLDENFNEEWVIRVDRVRLTTGALLNDGSLFLGGYKNLNNNGSTLWYGKLEKVRPPKPGDHIPVL